jgi:hypothetical protein
LLPFDGEVVAAVGLFRGPRPGLEAWLSPCGGVVGGAIGGIVAVGVLSGRRQHAVLVATADRAALVSTSARGRPREVERIVEFEQITEISDAIGDPYIDVAGVRYWLADDGLQVFRLRRAMSVHAARS